LTHQLNPIDRASRERIVTADIIFEKRTLADLVRERESDCFDITNRCGRVDELLVICGERLEAIKFLRPEKYRDMRALFVRDLLRHQKSPPPAQQAVAGPGTDRGFVPRAVRIFAIVLGLSAGESKPFYFNPFDRPSQYG
jgi:hypothetical protein